MTLKSIREYVESIRERYYQATRVEKGQILDEFIKFTGYPRKAAIRVLTKNSPRQGQVSYGQAPNEVHEHEWPGLIAMIGYDPQHPHDLGSVFTVDMDAETHYITKSILVCIPAHVKHCPWKFLDIRKTTLTTTASPSGLYYRGSITVPKKTGGNNICVFTRQFLNG